MASPVLRVLRFFDRAWLFSLVLILCLLMGNFPATAEPGTQNATVIPAQNATIPALPKQNAIVPAPGAEKSLSPLPESDKPLTSIPATANKNATRRYNATAAPVALDPAWKPLLTRLVADGFDAAEIEPLFVQLGPKSYSSAYMAAKITELYGVGGVGIRRRDSAAPILPDGYEQPLSEFNIGSCKAFMTQYAKELADIEAKHGVPARTIVGLLLVETGLGTDLGSDIALRSLAGMAATTTPQLLGSSGNSAQIARVRAASLASTLKVKSDWAYNEVKALLRYGKETGTDISKMPGSIYGAVGICQFMPSNIEPYGVDGDGDGKVDLFSVVDAMYSVGNYLEANGWRAAMSPQQQFMVIKTYNQDNIYAAQVLGASNQLALAIKGKVSDARSPLAGVGPVPASALDPSLRRARRVPVAARVKSLGSYESLLQ